MGTDATAGKELKADAKRMEISGIRENKPQTNTIQKMERAL